MEYKKEKNVVHYAETFRMRHNRPLDFPRFLVKLLPFLLLFFLKEKEKDVRSFIILMSAVLDDV